MLDAMTRTLVNTIYKVQSRVRKVEKSDPAISVVAAGASKGRRLSANHDVRYEAGWMTARRNVLILTNQDLRCGDWKIPLDSITQAQLLRVNGLLTGGYIIKIATQNGDHYQFGVQNDPSWENQDVLQFEVGQTAIGSSLFSIGIRLAVLAYVAWVIYRLLT